MSPHPSVKVQRAGEIIAYHMDAILALFRPGAKIAVIVMAANDPEHRRGLVQTNAEIDDVIAALERRKRPAETQTGEV